MTLKWSFSSICPLFVCLGGGDIQRKICTQTCKKKIFIIQNNLIGPKRTISYQVTLMRCTETA